MLQENILTGLLFLAGITVGSWLMGVAALVSVITGTVTAFILKYPKENIESGLYGFSAALTGVALTLFFEPALIIWICIVAGSVLAAIIQQLFIKMKMPVFTLPFVLVTWVLFFCLSKWYPDYLKSNPAQEISSWEIYFFAVKGFGQVIFQGGIMSGIIFLIAVFISSPAAAIYGLVGAVISTFIAMIFSMPSSEISMGLFGYNAVLSAIVFANNKTGIRNVILMLTTVMLTAGISIVMYRYKMLQLTFPFVAASFIAVTLSKNNSDSPEFSEQEL